MNFTDLNKACPNDFLPWPKIDVLVDATTIYEILKFKDAFFSCNQIMMHKPDQEKISFITKDGTYCYKVMPFGLKNTRATYQRLVNGMFKDLIGSFD